MKTSHRSGLGRRRATPRELGAQVQEIVSAMTSKLEAKLAEAQVALAAALREGDALRSEVAALREGSVTREEHEARVASERRAHGVVAETLKACAAERDRLKADLARMDRALEVTLARCDALPGLLEEVISASIDEHHGALQAIWADAQQKLVNRLRTHLFGEEAAR